MDEPKRTMSREELHDLVWSTPMQKLAEIYGLSDRGLAKTCERYLVPVPPRGYWAKIDAGQSAKRTALRAVENTALHTVHIGGNPGRSPSPYLEQVLAIAQREIEDENRELAKNLLQPDATPHKPPEPATVRTPPSSSSQPPGKIHRDIRPFLSDLRACKTDRDGFVYLKYVKVAPRDVTRVGSFLSALAFELEAYGFVFDHKSNRIGFSKDGTTVDMGIEAPRKRVTEITKNGWKQFSYIHVGRLSLRIYGWADGIKKQWADTDTKQIEDSIDKVVESFPINHVAERERDERNRREAAAAAHMANRREMAELRHKREEKRLAYLRWIADARREVADLRATIALVPQEDEIPRDYARMIAWAQVRLASLEALTTVAQIQSTLMEKELFADPDPLHDPEGDPPAKANYWDR
ncbi:hypothetical protein [Rhizobium sp. Rhizsp82]|uniref:hypothetical protein n=1 Tax=Rhizobium sp. Rhizsp82 TaxID=3243057 RepID=UPI0039B490C4